MRPDQHNAVAAALSIPVRRSGPPGRPQGEPRRWCGVGHGVVVGGGVCDSKWAGVVKDSRKYATTGFLQHLWHCPPGSLPIRAPDDASEWIVG
eukprot:2740121-Alexandrium_andersonii.AAC.1